MFTTRETILCKNYRDKVGESFLFECRNVLKATIDIPEVGELNFYCTHLDHLDENWRMKQINAIIQSNDAPHILAGGLNSLDESDYSEERWTDIVKVFYISCTEL